MAILQVPHYITSNLSYGASFSNGSLWPIKATIHYVTNCNMAVTKLKQSCNTLVTTLLRFVA